MKVEPNKEDEQEMKLTSASISTDDLGLLDLQIVSFNDKKFEGSELDLENAPVTNSADEGEFKIKITPQGEDSGEARITFTLSDGVNSLTTSFNLTVQEASVEHEGWKNLKVLGARVSGSSYCEGGWRWR